MNSTGKSQMIHGAAATQENLGGERLGALDPGVIARAEAALQALSGQFAQWLQDEIDKLEAADAVIKAEGMTVAAGEALYLRAHDLKGLGATYAFPIVTRLAGSLCQLVEEPQKRAQIPLSLIDAHLEAIKTAVREDIRDDSHPLGGAMAQELENLVRAHQR
jgi:hypothetical protein